MKRIVMLSYFDNKIGPRVFYSYPKELLDANLKQEICNFVDFYNIGGYLVHVLHDKRIYNFGFDIFSDFSRGNIETLAISIITESDISKEKENKIIKAFNTFKCVIKGDEDFYLAFYYDKEFTEDIDKKIKDKKESLEFFVNKLYEEIE
jgi:hypothetical protein